LERKRREVEAKVAALRAELAEEKARIGRATEHEDERERTLAQEVAKIVSLRTANPTTKRQVE
jgi:hypothetical protein